MYFLYNLTDYYNKFKEWSSLRNADTFYYEMRNDTEFWTKSPRRFEYSLWFIILLVITVIVGTCAYIPVLYCFIKYRKKTFNTPHYTMALILGVVDVILLR